MVEEANVANVEEAISENGVVAFSQMPVEVALTFTPLYRPCVNGNAPPDAVIAPQAIAPVAEVVSALLPLQPDTVEIPRLEVDAKPVLEMLKSVVVAVGVDEAIINSVVVAPFEPTGVLIVNTAIEGELLPKAKRPLPVKRAISTGPLKNLIAEPGSLVTAEAACSLMPELPELTLFCSVTSPPEFTICKDEPVRLTAVFPIFEIAPEELIANWLEEALKRPVVVAPPLIVRPPWFKPLPMVEEAKTPIPTVVEVGAM